MISPNMGFGAQLFNRAGMRAVPGYGLTGFHGLGAHGDIPGPPYCIGTDANLQTYDDLIRYFGVEDCTKYDANMDPAGSYACVQRNAPKLVKVADFQQNCSYPQSLQAGYNPGNPYGNPYGYGYGYTYGQNQVIPVTYAPSGPPPVANPYIQPSPGPSPSPSPSAPPVGQGAGATYNAVMSFSNTSSGNSSSFKVGDSYQIRITGAKPNTSVFIDAVGPTGIESFANMGNTDSNGNYSVSGSMSDGEVGNWRQTWTVGGSNVSGGVISFNVSSNVNTTPTYTPPPTYTAPPNVPTVTPPPTYANPNPIPVTLPPPVTITTPSQGNLPPVTTATNQGNPTPPATNTTNQGVTPGFNFGDFFAGIEDLFSPSQWGNVFNSGNGAEIAGLAGAVVVVGWIGLKMFKIIR